MTRSARSSRDGPITTASALAALRFTTRLKVVGCSTGRSAGQAPLRTFRFGRSHVGRSRTSLAHTTATHLPLQTAGRSRSRPDGSWRQRPRCRPDVAGTKRCSSPARRRWRAGRPARPVMASQRASQPSQRRNSACRSIPEGITPQHAISARRPGVSSKGSSHGGCVPWCSRLRGAHGFRGGPISGVAIGGASPMKTTIS